MRNIALGIGAAACMALASPFEGSAGHANPLHATTDFRLLTLGGHHVKWGESILGTGAVVSYAFVTEPMQFGNARNCASLVPMDGLMERAGFQPEDVTRETLAAFREWELAADILFVESDDPNRADILIGAQGEPVGRAFANVSYRPGSGRDVKIIDRALICLNPQQPWKIGFDGNMDVYDFRYTMVHEIGHAIGLDHPSPLGQMMSFRYSEQFRELQDGDLQGVAVLYGFGAARLAAGGAGAADDHRETAETYENALR